MTEFILSIAALLGSLAAFFAALICVLIFGTVLFYIAKMLFLFTFRRKALAEAVDKEIDKLAKEQRVYRKDLNVN